MMKDHLMDWLAQRAAECEGRRASLAAEGREDESTFERIRYNVYDLFRTSTQAIHRAQQNEAAAWRMFEQRLEDIPAAWQRSHDLAELHGDTKKAHIERIKLDAAEDIRRFYAWLRGEQV